MPKIDGFQNHHVIPKFLANHDVLTKIGYDVNKVNNLIYLPEEIGGYGNRAAHKGYSGDHSNYNKMMRQELDDILEAGKSQNWSKQQYENAVDDLRKNTRQGLRNGTIKFR